MIGDRMDQSKVRIRYYEPKDYDRVVGLFKSGMFENWWNCYKRSINFQSIHASSLQLLLLIFLLTFLNPLPLIICELLIQLPFMAFAFYLFWDYTK